MIKFQDEPIADPVCVPLYYVSKLARENNVIVCQVGEGADELFWGYPNWKSLYKLSEETFVEESESLKQGAAGAGLTDND